MAKKSGNSAVMEPPAMTTDQLVGAVRATRMEIRQESLAWLKRAVADHQDGKPIDAMDLDQALVETCLTENDFAAMVAQTRLRRQQAAALAGEAALHEEYDQASKGVAAFRAELKRRQDALEEWERTTRRATNGRLNLARTALDEIEATKRDLLVDSPRWEEYQSTQTQIRLAGEKLIKLRQEIEGLEIRIRDAHSANDMGHGTRRFPRIDQAEQKTKLEETMLANRQNELAELEHRLADMQATLTKIAVQAADSAAEL